MVAQLLAVNPALADARCSDGWTALHAAAQGGHENVVTQLLAARPCLLHSLTTTKQTPLHLAVFRAHDKVVALLLAAARPIIQGSALNPLPELASIDARDFRGKTVLHCAANHEFDLAVIHYKHSLIELFRESVSF